MVLCPRNENIFIHLGLVWHLWGQRPFHFFLFSGRTWAKLWFRVGVCELVLDALFPLGHLEEPTWPAKWIQTEEEWRRLTSGVFSQQRKYSQSWGGERWSQAESHLLFLLPSSLCSLVLYFIHSARMLSCAQDWLLPSTHPLSGLSCCCCFLFLNRVYVHS